MIGLVVSLCLVDPEISRSVVREQSIATVRGEYGFPCLDVE